MDKQALRRDILAKRMALPAAERAAADQAILQKIQAYHTHLNREDEAVWLVYLDFRGEVGTEQVIEWALAQGIIVCAPLVVKAERRLIPVRIRSLDELVVGAYGIREPVLREENVIAPEQIDVVLLPGVAFNRTGGRLGYGGGYYDRFLPQLRADCVKVALAYELQVVDELPVEEHDVWYDVLITERAD